MNNIPANTHIILLGGNGFLGSLLYSSLLHEGFIVKKSKFDLEFLESKFSRANSEIKTLLISMAWCSNSKPDYLEDPENLIWQQKHIEIAKFCTKYDYNLIIPGTCLEYNPEQASKYLKSKIQLRKFLEDNLDEKTFLWIKFFYVFSITHGRPTLIRNALEAKASANPLIVNNLQGKHDYIEARDAINQLLELIKGSYYGQWDIGTGQARSNLELLRRIAAFEIVDRKQSVIAWEGVAKELVPNHAQLLEYTNQFFGTD